jgi:hypothetical protein
MHIVKSLLVGVLFSVTLTSQAQQESLCSSSEQKIFSCRTGRKIISVCASKAFTRDSGYLQYRFGIKGSIELVYPRSKVPAKDRFYYYDIGYSRGWIDHLSFKNGKYKYIVYEKFLFDGDVYGGDHHTSTSGIITVDPSGREVDLKCNGHVFRSFGPNMKVLQRADDFYPYKG